MTSECSKQGNCTESSSRTDLPKAKLSRAGRYETPGLHFIKPGFFNLLKFMREDRFATIPSVNELDKHLPVHHPEKEKLDHPREGTVQVTWLGHACVLVQMEGLNILTDPVFSDYCGPVQRFPVPKRYRPVPCAISELPDIHAVVISHNHYDHLDLNSVKELNKRFGEKLKWFVPKGLKSWMESTGCKNVCELEWWDEHDFKCGVKFVFTPALHWSKRGLLDDNKTLWGSWCVIGSKKRFYFAGDTGYNDSIFKLIGEQYGPFSLAAIPIGAYSPRWFMQCQHIDPTEALQIHKDIRAEKSIGVHWGTFNLSSESYLEPREKIKELQTTDNEADFFTLDPGETKGLS